MRKLSNALHLCFDAFVKRHHFLKARDADREGRRAAGRRAERKRRLKIARFLERRKESRRPSNRRRRPSLQLTLSPRARGTPRPIPCRAARRLRPWRRAHGVSLRLQALGKREHGLVRAGRRVKQRRKLFPVRLDEERAVRQRGKQQLSRRVDDQPRPFFPAMPAMRA